VKFGISVYSWEPFSYTPRIYEDLAVEAERLGYDSYLTTDHFLRPHATGHVEIKQHSTIEAWTLLSYVAAKTTTIKIGTCISPIPIRKPQVLAKIVASLDCLSGGRVILGAGPGRDQREFEGYGDVGWKSASERIERTREGLEIIRRLWTEDTVTYDGKYYKTDNLILEPKPIQKPGPPIWLGGHHDKMLSLVAEQGDGWILGRLLYGSIEEYGTAYRKIKADMQSAGRTRPLLPALQGWFIAPGVPFTIGPYIGEIDKAAKIIEGYRNEGCEYMSLLFYPLDEFKGMMRDFARDIVPSFS